MKKLIVILVFGMILVLIGIFLETLNITSNFSGLMIQVGLVIQIFTVLLIILFIYKNKIKLS